MSKGGGGGGTTTSVQKADPWIGLQVPLQQLYGGATANYNTGGPQYYPGQTVAPTNWNIQHALEMGRNASMSGQNPNQGLLDASAHTLQRNTADPAMSDNPAYGILSQYANGNVIGNNPSANYFQSAMNGQFLNGNPYTEQMVQAAQRPVVSNFQNAIAPALASQFSLAGRTGSGAHANAFGQAADSLGRTLADQSANLYGSTYNSERQLQQQAAGQVSQQDQFERGNQLRGAEDVTNQFGQQRQLGQAAALAAPGFASANQNLTYDNISKLLGVGQFEQSQQQDLINADKQRFDFNQNRPNMNLQMLNQILQGGSAYAGRSTTGNESLNRNPFNSALGGASAGFGLGEWAGGIGSMGGPIGLGLGALLGGLFG